MRTAFDESAWGLPVEQDMKAHLKHLEQRLNTGYYLDVIGSKWTVLSISTGGAICPVRVEGISPIGAEIASPEFRETYEEPIRWKLKLVRPSWKRMDLRLGAITLCKSRLLESAGQNPTGVLIKDLFDELAKMINDKLDEMRWEPRGVLVYEEPRIRVGVKDQTELVRMDAALALAAGVRFGSGL